MTIIANMLATASRLGTSRPPVITQYRHKSPTRLGLLRGRSWLGALFMLISFFAMTAGIDSASASTGFPTNWDARYPSSLSDDNMISATGSACQMCHEKLSGGNTWNGYGYALKVQLNGGETIDQALISVEGADSDGNGDSNLVEINADAQPGWVPGEANLIYRANGPTNKTSEPPPTGVINLDPTGDPPVANDDTGTVAEGGSVPIDVVANDTDADGTVDATTVTIITDVSNGATVVNPTTGVVTYTHDGSETTSDSFTYTVNDNSGLTSNTATVTITVTPVNDPPVANNDSDTVAEGGSVPIDVVANDTDADGTVDATTVIIITDVANGSTAINPTTGVVTYTHDGSETVSDSFTYTVQDNNGATSNTATVNITVTPVNDPPVANNDSDTVAEDASVVIAVLANDTDADGTLNPATVSATNGANGTTSVNTSTGEVTYTHDGSETTSDSFTYTVQDNNGATSNIATVIITVTPVNDPPVANNDSDTVAEDASVDIDVVANDTDADGTVDATTVTIITDAANGSTAVNPTTGVVTYTHDGSETTSDSFTYTVQDNNGATSNIATVTITVTPVNDPPVANDDADTVAEGNSVVIAVLANDTDADGTLNPATVSATNGANGTTSVNTSTGEVTYTHNGSATVSDSFTYTVQDNNGATSNTATVNITVTQANDPPVANNDSDTVAEGGSVPIDVLANDTDADGTVNATTVTIITDVTNGSTAVNPTTGVVTYTHDGSETVSDSFTYTVDDNLGATSNIATVTITVTPVNDPPVANDDADTVAEGGSVPIDVLANDTDADGTVNATTVTIVTDVTNGSTAVNPATGVVTYTHNGSATVSDSFTYTVQDNSGATSNTATVTITVTPVNDPPVANNDSDTVAEDASVDIDVVANDTDADGTVDATTVTIITDVTNGSTAVNPTTGVVTYTHDGSETTSDSFTYTVQDNNGATSNIATVTITVTPVNDPPVANDDSDTVAEDASVDIDVVANDTDADGTVDATTVIIITDVTNGSTAVNPTTGVVTYTHDGSETTSDSFTYTVQDNNGATSNTATVTITVTPVNDPPVANDDADTVAEGGSVPIDVVANDTDADGTVDATTVIIITDVTNGSTAVNPTTGVVTYTHDGSATVSDSFTYTVQDNNGATSNTATVNITVTPAPGPDQATNLWAHNISSTSMTLFWTEGTGDGSIVVMKQGSAVDATPTDGTEYLADKVFGSGADLGGSNFVVYRGNGESVHVTGLTSLQTYHVAVFAYEGAGELVEYLLPDPAIGNETTTDYTPHNVAVLNLDDTVTCTTGCHGGHGSALVPRGTEQETACVSCHNPASGVPGASALTNFSLHTNSKGMPLSSPGVVDCGSCHELHNPGGDSTTYSINPDTLASDFNLHFLRSNPDKYVPTALSSDLVVHADTNSEDWAFEDGLAYQGACQICHTLTPGGYQNTNAGDDIHQGGDLGNVDCRGCHDHGGNFAGAGGDCTQCHASEKGTMPRRIVTTEFSGGGIVSSHLPGTLDAADCEVCHNHTTGSAHKTGKVNLFNADTGAAIELATRTDPRTSQTESEKLTVFCLACHDSDGANGNNSPFTTAGTTVDIQASLREHTNDGSGSVSCFGDGNFGCHGSGHGGQKLAILAPAESGPGASPDFTDENETFCLNCHDSSGTALTPAAPNILADLGGSLAVSVEKVEADSGAFVNQNHDILPADKDWNAANDPGSVRPTITCSDCHLPPHDATAGSPVKNPDTGLTFSSTYATNKTWSYLDSKSNPVTQTYWDSSSDQSPITPEGGGTHDSTDYVEFCLTCHDGDPPPGIVMSADLLNIAETYGAEYHGAKPNSGTGTSINRGGMKAPWTTGGDSKDEDPSGPYAAFPCTICHGPHGSGSIFNLRTSINVAGTQMSTGSWGTGQPMDSIIGTYYELPKFGPGGVQENRVWGAWCTFCHQLSAHSYGEDQVCRSGHQHGGSNF